MRIALALAIVGCLFMSSCVTYGFIAGDGWNELVKLWNLPWGKVSLADVYVGFALFLGWVIYREQSLVKSLIWIILVLTLGNAITCLYAAIALYQAKGNWQKFWLGNQV